MSRAILDIAGRAVRVTTTCTPALDYLSGLDHFVGIRPFRVREDVPSLRLPTLRYTDRGPGQASYDGAAQLLDVAFPWDPDAIDLFEVGRPFHNLLLYPLRMVLELARQEVGEYTVHASAVVRDGQAIVLSGEAEAGKTTTAVSLCHAFGFALFANDETLISAPDGRAWVVNGDQDISLRLSSASRYSSPLAERMFTDTAGPDRWEIKRDVVATDLGVVVTGEPTPVRLFVKIRLDDTVDDAVVRILSARAVPDMDLRTRRALFRTKIDLHREAAQVIRGAVFTPLRDRDMDMLDLYVPSLDRPTFMTKRVEFVNAVFGAEGTAVVSIRGPIEACGRELVTLFESLADPGPPDRT